MVGFVFILFNNFLELSPPLTSIQKLNDDSITKEWSVILKIKFIGVSSDSEVTFFGHVLALEEFALTDFLEVNLLGEVVGVETFWEGGDVFGLVLVGDVFETYEIE